MDDFGGGDDARVRHAKFGCREEAAGSTRSGHLLRQFLGGLFRPLREHLDGYNDGTRTSEGANGGDNGISSRDAMSRVQGGCRRRQALEAPTTRLHHGRTPRARAVHTRSAAPAAPNLAAKCRTHRLAWGAGVEHTGVPPGKTRGGVTTPSLCLSLSATRILGARSITTKADPVGFTIKADPVGSTIKADPFGDPPRR